jgi:flagellin-like hook-associated protein FlgL
MEVNDIKKPTVDSGKVAQSVKSTPKQRSLSTLSAQSVDVARADSVSIKVDGQGARSESTAKSRERANALINVVNFAAEATQGIDDLVRSVSGIADQVGKPETPPARAQVLESEANSLVEEIRKQANRPGPDGVRVLAGDSVTVDLEEKLGKTLEVLLPDHASDAFGLGTIEFSTKDAVIATRANIEQARQRLEVLKEAVSGARNEVVSSVNQLEVALQNDEAARSSIRDVEGALEVSNTVRSDIKLNPGSALASLGPISDAEALLK